MNDQQELTLPRASVPSLHDLEVTVVSPSAPTADELIEQLYERLRASAPRRERGKGEVLELGDDVICDLAVTVDGHLIPGGVRAWTNLELREYPLLPGLVEALIGSSPQTEVQTRITLPADYPAEQFAGREAELSVFVHQAFEIAQPDMEDAAALGKAGLGSGINEAMQILADELDEEKGQQLLLKATQEVLAEFGRRVRVEISEGLIDSELQRVWEESFEDALARMGFEDGQIDDAWYDYAEDPALREEVATRLKTDAGLRAVAEQEEFAPDLKDIDEFLAGTAEAVGVSRESASQWIREQEELSRTVINSSIHRQAIEYVMARAKINVLD